jgi:peptidoglycan/LPS O-acetylase OafA/YrhL
MKTNKIERSDNLQSVQLLRGLAALVVMLHHSVGGDYLSKSNIVRIVAESGWMGVEIFFIISGFIISYSMFKKDYKVTRDFRVFFLKRIIRIEPPYIVSIVIVLILGWATTLSGWYHGPAFHVNWLNVLGHIGYINVFTGQPWLNLAYWTLAVEFEYYLILAFTYPLITHSNKVILLGTTAVLLASAFLPVPPGHIFRYLPFFVMGIGLFLLTTKQIKPLPFFITIAAASVLVWYIHGPLVLMLGLVTLPCIYYIRRVPQSFLFLGTISYSLYLTHGFIVTRVMAVLERYMKHVPMSMRLAICVVVCIVFAYVFYLFVEKPFQEWSKKIRYRKPSVPVASPAIEPEIIAASVAD